MHFLRICRSPIIEQSTGQSPNIIVWIAAIFEVSNPLDAFMLTKLRFIENYISYIKYRFLSLDAKK